MMLATFLQAAVGAALGNGVIALGAAIGLELAVIALVNLSVWGL